METTIHHRTVRALFILFISGCCCGRWMTGVVGQAASSPMASSWSLAAFSSAAFSGSSAASSSPGADGSLNGLSTIPAGPEFAEPIRNVTVPLGREAVLSCIINNLAEYKVGWLRADDQTILSLHRRVVTHNPRVSVTHDESRTWNLHIRQIKESDQGCYMCQINTATMKKQLGCIQVQVPPDIVDERSTSDVTVNEGDNVTLTCTATGKPAPRIVWRREDGQKMVVSRGGGGGSGSSSGHGGNKSGASSRVTTSSSSSSSNHNNNNKTPVTIWSAGSSPASPKPLEWASLLEAAQADGPVSAYSQHAAVASTRERSKEVDAYHGETLRLYRVTRQMMGAYMCIASNDVPPAVSKRVPLNVNFSPLVTASMNVVGALLGSDVRLTCLVESHPPSINYWMKGRHQEHSTILPSAKYSIDGERGSSSPSYKSSMTLVIHDFQPQDRSAYICVAANSLGTAEASIQIYEVARATSGPQTSRSAAPTDGLHTVDGGFDDENTIYHQGGGEGHAATRSRQSKGNNNGDGHSAGGKKHAHAHETSSMSMTPRDQHREQQQHSSPSHESAKSSRNRDSHTRSSSSSSSTDSSSIDRTIQMAITLLFAVCASSRSVWTSCLF